MKTYLNLEEIKLLEESTNNLRDKLLIRLLFTTACRISEVLTLSVSDVDLEQGTLTIKHLKSRVILSCPNCGAGLSRRHVFCPGCALRISETLIKKREERRVRTVPIDRTTASQLNDFIERGGPVNHNGKLILFGINRHRAWQIIRDCALKAGLPKLVNPETGKLHHISPHRLRDAFAVHAVKKDDSGDGLRMLQEHLGHASINTTMRYRKVAGEEHRQWYDRLWKEGD